MTDELQPCPFCGGDAHMTETSHTKSGDLAGASVQVSWSRTSATYAVSCDKCDIGMTNPYLKADDAIAAWNRRADHIVDPNKMAPPALDAALIKSKASGPPIPMDEILATAKAEPAGDLEKQIKEIIFWHVDFAPEDGGTTVTGIGSAARSILALFQPQMEAADEHQRTMEALKDPIAVLVNMQRGTIAVPSLRACLDLHGKLGAWDAAGELLGAAGGLQEVYADENACGMDKALARRKLYDVIDTAIAAGLGREIHD